MNMPRLTKLRIGRAEIMVLTDVANSHPVTQIQQRVIFDSYCRASGPEYTVVRPRRGEMLAMPLLLDGKPMIGMNVRADDVTLHMTVSVDDFDKLVDHLLLTQQIIRLEQEGLVPPDQPAPLG